MINELLTTFKVISSLHVPFSTIQLKEVEPPGVKSSISELYNVVFSTVPSPLFFTHLPSPKVGLLAVSDIDVSHVSIKGSESNSATTLLFTTNTSA